MRSCFVNCISQIWNWLSMCLCGSKRLGMPTSIHDLRLPIIQALLIHWAQGVKDLNMEWFRIKRSWVFYEKLRGITSIILSFPNRTVDIDINWFARFTAQFSILHAITTQINIKSITEFCLKKTLPVTEVRSAPRKGTSSNFSCLSTVYNKLHTI